MSNRFIMGLWSNGPAWEHTKEMFASLGCHNAILLPAAVYVFDDAAEEFCDRQLITCERLEPDEFCNGPKRHWRHKMLAIRDALTAYNDVLWLDADVVMLHDTLPSMFWDRLRNGAPVQAKLSRRRRRLSYWRTDDTDDLWVPSQYVCMGAFIYCRDVEIVDRCLHYMQHNANYSDEQAMGRVIDDLSGGWQGPNAWKQNGYDPSWFAYKWEVHKCPFPVFVTQRHGKYGRLRLAEVKRGI